MTPPYLPKELAEEYYVRFNTWLEADKRVLCQAKLYGGKKQADGEMGNYGVSVMLPAHPPSYETWLKTNSPRK